MESTNAPATPPPSPEMRPEGQTEKPVATEATPRVHERHPCTPEPRDASGRTATILPWSDAHATIRAQAGKKRDYSLPHTSTLPLSDTQIANSPQTLNSPPDAIDSPPDAIAQVEKKTLKRDNSPSDAINTVPSPIADASYLSSPNVSSLCDFPAEYKRLEYVGSQFISGSLIASPCRGDRLVTPKRMAPQPHHHTDICDEYF
ncbi:unnamed protein product [Boreogadus saida]